MAQVDVSDQFATSSEGGVSDAAPRPRAARTAGTRQAVAESGRRVTSTAAGQSRRVAGRVAGEGERVTSAAVDRGQQVAWTTSRQAGELATTAREQALQVREELSEQARGLVQQTRSQLGDQANAQTQRLAETFRGAGSQFKALAEGRPDEAGPLVDYVERAADRLTTLANEIELRGPDGLVDELRTFARRRPGAFVLGAALVGVGVGRLLRGAGGDEGEEETEDELDNGAAPRRRTRALGRGASGGEL